MLAVNAVYVAHYSPLVERRAFLETQLAKYNIGCEWFEQEPSSQEIERLYNPSPSAWQMKISQIPNQSPEPFRSLNRVDVSLVYKHIKMYEKIVEKNILTCLVLEDDVIFEEDFVNRFNFNLCDLPKDWDMVFIGSGCNLRIDPLRLKDGKISYLKDHPASKCSDSYIIKKSSAEKILSTVIPFSFPIDFELNYQMYLHDMKVYWWEPPLIKQGSESGLFNITPVCLKCGKRGCQEHEEN